MRNNTDANCSPQFAAAPPLYCVCLSVVWSRIFTIHTLLWSDYPQKPQEISVRTDAVPGMLPAARVSPEASFQQRSSRSWRRFSLMTLIQSRPKNTGFPNQVNKPALVVIKARSSAWVQCSTFAVEVFQRETTVTPTCVQIFRSYALRCGWSFPDPRSRP